MPYTSVDQVPSNVPAEKKKQWLEVWNSAYKAAKKAGKSEKDAEQQAFAEANGVIKKEEKSMSVKREVRFFQNCEMRASEDGEPMRISGYAATWDSPSEILADFFGPGFVEKIKRGAFARALSEKQDVRALVNHDPSQIIGRSANGTLRLEEDDKGLRYEIDLPDTQTGRDIHTLVKRGDISQSSFGFRVFRDGKKRGEEWFEPEAGPAERTLTDVDLFDVSPVTYPAYPQTSVSARSLWPDGMPAEIAEHVREARFVAHVAGHKNSDGDLAEWVIKSEKDGHIISSFKTEAEAKEALKVMEAKKHDEQNSDDPREENSLDIQLGDIRRSLTTVRCALSIEAERIGK